MDTPVMMSALVRGMLFTVRQMPRKRLPRFRKPMAAAVPATVEMTAARADTARVVARALRMRVLWNSWVYQVREKPPHTVRELASLKEKTMRMRMGA